MTTKWTISPAALASMNEALEQLENAQSDLEAQFDENEQENSEWPESADGQSVRDWLTMNEDDIEEIRTRLDRLVSVWDREA